MRSLPALLLGGTLSTAACHFEDLVATVDGVAGQGQSAIEPCQCGDPSCGVCPPTPMVRVPTTMGEFFIDAREVTFADYTAFLSVRPTPTSVDPRCDWNESHVPAQTSFETAGPDCRTSFDYASRAQAAPNEPVVCVDFCDAADYCHWARKRLCGSVGGGPLTLDQAGDALSSEWLYSCTARGQRAYPYGDDFDQKACNGAGSGSNEFAVEVGTYPACEGPYPGLFDMVGNVDEWVDVCAAGLPDRTTSCARMGGAYWLYEPSELRCDSRLLSRRSEVGTAIGIRCCSDGPG